ncbi:hypothetical protein [Brachybacterium sp. SGAir0954]|uniref:hypothetical protein n=1 Tax=Brachybacterium sp. SGAir0954 TaxID=2571029 RepID=UPI0010F6248C|nr:hypothetical protein [Brachybacterium sp. SGAir0954]
MSTRRFLPRGSRTYELSRCLSPDSFAGLTVPASTHASPGDAYGDLAPGDLAENGAHLYLRHLDGALCALREAGLIAEDARNCVRGGADVLLNPQSLSTPAGVACWPCDSSFWLRHADAAALARTAPEPLDEDLPATFALFMGPDGEAVVMATGALSWGPTLRVLDHDGTTVPAAAVPLSPSFPTPGEGAEALHVVGD